MLDAGAPEVVRDAARHADRRARAVPRLLAVAEAGAAVPALVEARSLAGLAVEDERAVRPPPGVLALDHRHQLGRVLGVDRDLLLVARLIQLRPERESPVRCRVVWSGARATTSRRSGSAGSSPSRSRTIYARSQVCSTSPSAAAAASSRSRVRPRA